MFYGVYMRKKTNQLKETMKYKNYEIKPADYFNKDYLIYFNNYFIKGCSSIEQSKKYIDQKIVVEKQNDFLKNN